MISPLLVWTRRIALGVLVGILLVFALIGMLQTFRGTPIDRVHVAPGALEGVAVGEPSFRRAAEALTGMYLEAGHEVEILLDGEVLQRLVHDLRSARSSIAIRNYYALPGAVADTFATILAERAAAGVSVLLLYDDVGSDLDEANIRRMRDAGVAVRPFRPIRWFTLGRAQHRSHVRAYVIDGRIGYTGGFGLADVWLGGGRSGGSWRETSVRFTGPAVATLQASVSVGWAEAAGTLLVGPPFFLADEPVAEGGSVAGLLYAVPGHGSTQAERFLLLSILGARRTLYITNPYFVPDDDQRGLLADAARRGVDVRVLTASDNTDVPLARLAGRAGYEELLRAGVRIYEYEPTMLHAKSLVADGLWATVGTMNFDNRSAALNEESNLGAVDATIGGRLDSIFLTDLRHARELQLDRFVRRAWHRRLMERLATLASRLL